MQGVDNASALVEEDARTSNSQWMQHLDASGLHVSVPFELLCCGVRDVREVVGCVFSPPNGDIRCVVYVEFMQLRLFNSAATVHVNLRLFCFVQFSA